MVILTKIKVLVADDSAFMRKVISDILNTDEDIEVVGFARDGEDAIKKVEALRPDVITLDIVMPKMDGLTALFHIMTSNPTPVVMVSSMDKREADIAVQSLEYGAIDFVSKPSRVTEMEDKRKELLEKIKTAAMVDVTLLKLTHPEQSYIKDLLVPSTKKQLKVIVIGSSTGGPRAVMKILSELPKDNLSAAILVVQHMGAGFTSSFAERLDRVSLWDVVEAREGEVMRSGKVVVASGDYHMTIEGKKVNGQMSMIIHTDKGPKVNNVRPSVDVTMDSVARVYGSNTLGIILSGMGSDGARGLKTIKEKGGKTLAQNKSSCLIYGMPKAAVELGCVDKVVDLKNIPTKIVEMVR
jgi:two-component system chemotaxis response regulator CheB